MRMRKELRVKRLRSFEAVSSLSLNGGVLCVFFTEVKKKRGISDRFYLALSWRKGGDFDRMELSEN